MRLTIVIVLGLILSAPLLAADKGKIAYFAGGCFWCMESDFEQLDGVFEVESGYMGGHTAKPNYKSVSAGGTGHAEVVRIIYDPEVISYAELLDHFWHNVDPLTANAQFCDKGSQYRTAIFSDNEQELAQARASKHAIEEQLGKPVVTQIAKADNFTLAEEYHQDYYAKNSLRYHYYRYGCGRDKRLEELWGKAKTK